jgi:disulfide bond formation protein DsbB
MHHRGTRLKKISIEQNLVFFCVLYSISALLISFIYQYQNHIPCKFCNYQRLALAGVLAMGLLWLFTEYKSILRFSLNAFLSICLIVSLVHLGIQWGLISDICSVPQNVKSPEQFANLLNQADCSKDTWKIFEMPASLFNSLFSVTALSLFLFHGLVISRFERKSIQVIE